MNASDERVERLAALVEQQQLQIEAQARRLEVLQRQVSESPRRRIDDLEQAEAVRQKRPDEITGPRGDASAKPTLMARRRLLVGGATAGVAAAGALLAHATPAAAANGDTMVIGTDQTSSSATTLTLQGSGSTAFVAANNGAGPGLSGRSDSGWGVNGISQTGEGVHGTSGTDVGVRGVSTSGFGVHGTSGGGNAAVRGDSTDAYGVHATSQSTSAVYGLSTNGTGVVGSSTNGVGVIAVGPRANLRLSRSLSRSAPPLDSTSHVAGEMVTDKDANQWVCVADGTPGTWRKTAGPATAGQLHLLPTPVRAYDSRPGTAPGQGPKTPLAAGNVARTVSLTVGGSAVPPGAAGALVTILLLGATAGNGNFALYAADKAKPQANALVWGGSAGRFTTLAATAVDASGQVKVDASLPTDLVLDVIGYYL